MTLPARPSQKATVVPWALVTEDDAKTYLQRTTDDQATVIQQMINEATAAIEMYCRRRLASRVYDGGSGNPPPLMVDGTGRSDLLCPEWPITAVSSVKYKNGDEAGSLTTMTSTQWYEQPHGILHLPFGGGFPRGTRNIEIKATCGYTIADHPREIHTLKLACKRVLQIAWQDWDQGVGRGSGMSIAGQSISLINEDLPKDVKRLLAPFERLI